MSNAIASCHWDACETCEHWKKQHCPFTPEVSVCQGDWVVCDNYKRKDGGGG